MACVRTFGGVSTELSTIEAADSSHLYLQKFAAYLVAQRLEGAQPDLQSALRNCGALADLGGELRATLYGVLAFGKTPQKYVQTANFWVEGVAYEGSNRASNVLQVAEAKGTVDEQVSRAMGWFTGLGRFESYGAAVSIRSMSNAARSASPTTRLSSSAGATSRSSSIRGRNAGVPVSNQCGLNSRLRRNSSMP